MFEQFNFSRQLLDALVDIGYTEPTPIQEKVIPLAMNGQDILGIAQTGTGKTAAYVLPILSKLKYAQGMLPRALIIGPTRELVMQIHEMTKALAKYTDLRIVSVYGGIGMTNQLKEVEKGVDIFIATPGRLMDIYFREILKFKDLKVFVIDEADKMMDMGFMPQINKILEIIPKKRQNLLFSATMPAKVLLLSEDFLEFPTTVEITPAATPAETVEQRAYFTPNRQSKINFVEWLFRQEESPVQKAIIFTRSKLNANFVYNYLLEKKILRSDHIKVIHGNKGQHTRINAMEAFKNGTIKLLVATDVASRGLDVSEVNHVINFDVPIVYEDYVHRIGRTGRAKQLGQAHTLFNEAEQFHLLKIEKIIKMKIPVLDLPKGVLVEETPFDEQQSILKEIDFQKKKEDPDFKGAFHEKKKVFKKKPFNKNIKEKKISNHPFKKKNL